MLKSRFAPLAMKVSAGVIAALLIALMVQSWRVSSTIAKLEAARNELARVNAEMQLIVSESERRTKAGKEALGEARKARPVVDSQIAAIRAESGVSGDCVTNPAVMGADL